MIGWNMQLVEDRLGVKRHLDLTGHRLAYFATIGNQHWQRDLVELDQLYSEMEVINNEIKSLQVELEAIGEVLP